MTEAVSDIKVSVIVPVYKVEPYLDKCVESIVNQTHRNLEIILVDDGSPDKCGEMCDVWAQHDSRIVVIHQKNGGQSSARNTGLDAASGEYVGFIDSDDYISPHMIKLLLDNCVAYDADVSCCEYYKSNMPRPLYSPGDIYSALHMSGPEVVRCFYFGDEDPAKGIMCNKLYRRKLFRDNDIAFPEGKVYEDTAVIPKLLFLASSVVCVSANLYCYRIRTGSTIHSCVTSRKCFDCVDAVYDVVDFFGSTVESEELLRGSFSAACGIAISTYAKANMMEDRDDRMNSKSYIIGKYKAYWKSYANICLLPLLKKITFFSFIIFPDLLAKPISVILERRHRRSDAKKCDR